MVWSVSDKPATVEVVSMAASRALSMVCLLIASDICASSSPSSSSYLPTYDIWNDGAKLETKTKQPKGRQHHHQQQQAARNAPSAAMTIMRHNATRTKKSLSMFNFFSFSNEENECIAEDGRRSGLCVNPYACRRRGGASSGTCGGLVAFEVCCVFTTTCGAEVKNNVTYFLSPQFPSVSRSFQDGCTLMVKKMDGASQLRLDFVHFNMGQPNRLTGECDSDVFTITGGGGKDFKLCGQNTDQHIYYDMNKNSNRVMINLKMPRQNVQRFWEIKITQVPFGQRAPDGCLQYFTNPSGFIQTLNYADNGRHLADQDYKSCVRQQLGMCTIAYEPCDARSFRIGQNAALAGPLGLIGGGGGPGAYGGAGTEGVVPSNYIGGGGAAGGGGGEGGGGGGASPAGVANEEELIGSGDGAIVDQPIASRELDRWNPYTQHLGNNRNDKEQLWRYWGYGNYGQGVSRFGRLKCTDRIILPCDGEDFLAVNTLSTGACDPFHCGSNLCPELEAGKSCRIETSVTPYAVGVKFGSPTAKTNPEDNIGMCLRYEQMPCAE